MKRIIIILLVVIFFVSFTLPGYAKSLASEFLCEIGIKLYQKGRYEEALHEFQKALIVEPHYTPALQYIQMIEEMSSKKEQGTEEISTLEPKAVISANKSEAINRYLDIIEIQTSLIKDRKIAPLSVAPILPQEIKFIQEAITAEEKPQTFPLEEYFSNGQQPIEIEQGRSKILLGKNIQRFLVTQPNIMAVERISKDGLLVSTKAIGYTYLHIWDDSGRKTVELLGVLPKPKGPTLEEKMFLDEQRANSFKFRYTMDWSFYEEGRRLANLKRQSYSWSHNLNLYGQTPYGKIDATAIARSLKESSDLTYLTMGLTQGSWNGFKDFTLRGFDFYPGFANMASGGISNLRGGMLQSPAFNKKIDYIAFWGREGAGRYGQLSPGLQKMRHSFFEGLDINLYPDQKLNYGFSIIRGYGRDRPEYLNDFAYDADVNWDIDKWKYRYEISNDTETFSHLFSGNYSQPKLNFNYELRNIDKNFLNIGGGTWRRGELGGIFNLNIDPNQDWNIYNRLDIYRDRLFPALDNDTRWNQDYDFVARHYINPTTSLRLDYTLENELGKISQTRYQTTGVNLSKSFNLIRKINSFVSFRHQERKNFSGPSANYINENLSTGVRFGLIGRLFYFLDKQWNWLEQRSTGSRSLPHVLESGVDFNGQVFKTPFYENIRILYRDEEDADSPFSFLSGEDYLEGYAELSFRPGPEKEMYCATRVRNVWAENHNVRKRIEADFNLGVRYLWDTGLRWDSVSSIEGYVFRDNNSDGLRQTDEAPVENVKLWLGKDKSVITDIFGHYKFSNIKGKKLFVSLDAQSLPSGYVLTVPQRQEIATTQSKTARVDFGIISRSEISGFVFYDINQDGEYNSNDVGIKGVSLILENQTKVATDSEGRYSFRNVSIGEHIISLDISSLPINYLPAVPVNQEINLFEGVTYKQNFPLKKTIK